MGTVTDQTGAVVRDAKRVLTSAMGARLAIPSMTRGLFRHRPLSRDLHANHIGSPTSPIWSSTTSTLTPGEKLTLDATLEPASAETSGRGEWRVSRRAKVLQLSGPTAQKIAGDKGAIRGTVTDQTDAVVTDAKAVLTSPTGENSNLR